MWKYLMVLFILLNSRSICGNLCITKMIVRVPRENDIGLIFDMTVTNRHNGERKLALELIVSSDGPCMVNTTKGERVQVGPIYGGNFGSVEPGKRETVSLVWPTVSLYNRVGYCPITISALNPSIEPARTKQLLHFDTRFETLDPENRTLRKRKDFTPCNNWDKEYFMNCLPVVCEERYFGQRSFYNYTTEQCEPVPACSKPGEYYDYYGNECVDPNNFITEEELEQIRQGQFDDNILELRPPPGCKTDQPKAKYKKPTPMTSPPPRTCPTRRSLADFNNCFQSLHERVSPDKKIGKKSTSQISLLQQLYYDWYLPLRADTWGENKAVESTPHHDGVISSGSQPLSAWLAEVDSSGLLLVTLKSIGIVAITILAYLLVCIVCAFLDMVAKIKNSEKTTDQLAEKLRPKEDETRVEVFTSESLMSYRL
ncbi:uncharacterized protein LOC117586725 isoform X2 [Drosophila guanche]|uniref:Chitin-binding type-2 domain-containing protein n=2 Tax=Drosophila guanche TaxID=7266 RepID=A0A3B0JTZ4_DROGU|nr:uncharacterized protein LOC117586725 isoform X2 [Drosophila guanche]SPP84533.1 Hypothetical predicted protein [Drosophila guanche]